MPCCYQCLLCLRYMKRKAHSANSNSSKSQKQISKQAKISEQDRASPAMGGGDMDTAEGTSPNIITYAVPVANRFEKLPIPIPTSHTVRIENSTNEPKPPPILADTSAATIFSILKGRKFGLINTNNGVRIACNSNDDHAATIKLLVDHKIAYHTFNYKSEKTKRFVIHGMNTHPIEDIMSELDEYGIKPTQITTIEITSPRYDDQAVYVAHYKNDSPITLNIVKNARYLCNTSVRWSHYHSNGDGVIFCSRCARQGHSGLYCNRPKKCGVCAEDGHTTAECKFILEKRRREAIEKKKLQIDPIHLKCPSCGGQHTVGYKNCPKRRPAISQARPKFIPAPMPEFNQWSFPSINKQQNNTNFNKETANQWTTGPILSSTDSGGRAGGSKFNSEELFDIFGKLIDIAEKSNSKYEQLRMLNQLFRDLTK